MAPRRRRKLIDPAAAVGTLFPLPGPQRLQPRGRPLRPLWTENKARLIERYLYYFVMITKGGNYIDAFAGPQDPQKPRNWAARLVLESRPRWLGQIHLFERDRQKLKLLEKLKAEQPPRGSNEPKRTIGIHSGDFNDEVLHLLRSGSIKRTRATFCLLDQHTFECKWATLKALAEYRSQDQKIELFYFLANDWLPRALAAIRDFKVPDAWWGNRGWQNLRGKKGIQRAQLLAERFRRELGYWSAQLYPIYKEKTGGRVMFYMVHATDHKDAPGLMARAYNRAVQPRESPEQVMMELGLSTRK